MTLTLAGQIVNRSLELLGVVVQSSYGRVAGPTEDTADVGGAVVLVVDHEVVSCSAYLAGLSKQDRSFSIR